MSGKIKDKQSDAILGIREFAARFDVTPRTIRFYEAKGLLTPSRGERGRVFGASDIVRLAGIMRAKRLGFTLDDIKEFLDIADGCIIDEVGLRRRKKKFEKIIQNLKRQREDIDIVTRDIAEICTVISEHLANTQQRDGVFELAGAYEAKFRQTMADDYEIEITTEK